METFEKVWYLPEPNQWSDMRLVAFRDVGKLSIHGDQIAFVGRKGRLTIAEITDVSFGKQGRDFINNWVGVDYGQGQKAFFADGSMLGWGGILGGTMKIYRAIEAFAARQR